MSTQTSSGFDGPPCGHPLLSALALSAVLAGCSHAPPQSWRVEPVLRVAGSDARAAAQGWRALARQYEGEGRLAQAVEAQRRAAQADPGDAESLHALGVKLARRGELAQGIAALRLANEMAPRQPQLLNNLGYALQLSGQPDQAQAMYEAALLADPNYEHARKNLRKLAKAARAQPVAPAEAAAVADLPAVSDTSIASTASTASATAVAAALVPEPVLAPVPIEFSAAAPADAVPAPMPESAAAPAAEPMPDAPAAAPMPVLEAPELLQLQTQPNLPAMTLASADDAVAQVAEDAAGPHAAVDIDLTVAATEAPVVDLPAEPATAAAAVDAASVLDGVRVEIINGNGLVGAAGALRNWLGEQGVKTARLANLPPYDMARTIVVYSPGHAAQAMELARRLPLQSLVRAAPAQSIRSGLRVVIGHDLRISAALHQLANQVNAHPALKKEAAKAAAPADAVEAMQRSLARR